MDTIVFAEKTKIPGNEDLASVLGETVALWETIRQFVLEKYPAGMEEWNYPGVKYGWNFRIKDKKRAIVYFIPRKGHFQVAFVFGNKATAQVMESDISAEIKTDLEKAIVYAEGRGIRIDVWDTKVIDDIKKLVVIKLAN